MCIRDRGFTFPVVPGKQCQGCEAQQVNGGFKYMNVLRIRLSLQEKREVLVAAGQLALIAADGAAQSAISYYCRRESLAVAKTEETGLREMEKSKTNTEMYPG